MNSYKRTYIKNVTPLENYILQLDYWNGSRLLLNLYPKLSSIRYRPLKKLEVWNSATTNGIFVRFGNHEFSHDELLALAEEQPKVETSWWMEEWSE